MLPRNWHQRECCPWFGMLALCKHAEHPHPERAARGPRAADCCREGRIERTQQMYDRLGWDFDAREDFE